ncbi:MAG: SEL1-like repeat protein [Lentisphaeria bacterium]|nr:SEL1-like repeat protein [Lentisphaeria bacterium]
MNEKESQKLKNRAEHGDAEAQFLLAKHYDGESPNCEEAVRWYRAAAEQGHAKAQNNLAICISENRGDCAESFKWFSMAAENGSPAGQFNLGRCYLYGKGASDFFAAITWLRRSAEQGYPKAEKMLANLEKERNLYSSAERGDLKAQYELALSCRGVFIKNEGEAAKWFQKSARGGYLPAQFELGLCFLYGKGVEKDEAEAMKWLGRAAGQGYREAQRAILEKTEFELILKAAEFGDAGSQYKIGTFYETGYGVRSNFKKALEWFKKAADQDDAEALYKLGTLSKMVSSEINPEIVDDDPEEKASPSAADWMSFGTAAAFEWFKKAADLGHMKAQFIIGLYYESGDDVKKDDGEAFEWFKKAADQGDAGAQYKVGLYYKNGIGVKKDGETAVEWFHKAAAHDQAGEEYLAIAGRALFEIGKCYYLGYGVKKDYALALEFFIRATHGFGSAGGLGPDETPMDMLALFYENGIGVKKDPERAKNWHYWAYRARGVMVEYIDVIR